MSFVANVSGFFNALFLYVIIFLQSVAHPFRLSASPRVEATTVTLCAESNKVEDLEKGNVLAEVTREKALVHTNRYSNSTTPPSVGSTEAPQEAPQEVPQVSHNLHSSIPIIVVHHAVDSPSDTIEESESVESIESILAASRLLDFPLPPDNLHTNYLLAAARRCPTPYSTKIETLQSKVSINSPVHSSEKSFVPASTIVEEPDFNNLSSSFSMHSTVSFAANLSTLAEVSDNDSSLPHQLSTYIEAPEIDISFSPTTEQETIPDIPDYLLYGQQFDRYRPCTPLSVIIEASESDESFVSAVEEVSSPTHTDYSLASSGSLTANEVSRFSDCSSMESIYSQDTSVTSSASPCSACPDSIFSPEIIESKSWMSFVSEINPSEEINPSKETEPELKPNVLIFQPSLTTTEEAHDDQDTPIKSIASEDDKVAITQCDTVVEAIEDRPSTQPDLNRTKSAKRVLSDHLKVLVKDAPETKTLVVEPQEEYISYTALVEYWPSKDEVGDDTCNMSLTAIAGDDWTSEDDDDESEDASTLSEILAYQALMDDTPWFLSVASHLSMCHESLPSNTLCTGSVRDSKSGSLDAAMSVFSGTLPLSVKKKKLVPAGLKHQDCVESTGAEEIDIVDSI